MQTLENRSRITFFILVMLQAYFFPRCSSALAVSITTISRHGSFNLARSHFPCFSAAAQKRNLFQFPDLDRALTFPRRSPIGSLAFSARALVVSVHVTFPSTHVFSSLLRVENTSARAGAVVGINAFFPFQFFRSPSCGGVLCCVKSFVCLSLLSYSLCYFSY